jgi:hypothetical protein
MEIFPGVFNGCMNNFHGNISMALNTNTASSAHISNLRVTGYILLLNVVQQNGELPNGEKLIGELKGLPFALNH